MSNEPKIPAATADELAWFDLVSRPGRLLCVNDDTALKLLRLAAHYKREAERLERVGNNVTAAYDKGRNKGLEEAAAVCEQMEKDNFYKSECLYDLFSATTEIRSRIEGDAR